MATLTIDRRAGKIAGYNVQWYDGKKRFTIHLGGKRYTKKTAERFKRIVEALLYYRRNGISIPDKSDEHWLANAPIELRSKLAKAGLIVVDEAKTCQMLWDAFLKFKAMEVKQKTMKNYSESQALFFEMFLPGEPVESLSHERLLEWKTSLQDAYAEGTVATHLKNLKAVLNWAVDQDWLTKSPARKIPTGSFRNREFDRFITIEEYALLLDACPTQEWRVIVALARIGGLRCPSELKQLRWADVDWEKNRFLVHSPKTERHVNHATRLVPLFSELRAEFDKSDKTTEFVVQSYQDTAWSLYEPFQEIAERSGIGKIACPFRNMRRSRANEVVRRWGETKESLWIGHTADVMEKHYRQHLDEDFATC